MKQVMTGGFRRSARLHTRVTWSHPLPLLARGSPLRDDPPRILMPIVDRSKRSRPLPPTSPFRDIHTRLSENRSGPEIRESRERRPVNGRCPIGIEMDEEAREL